MKRVTTGMLAVVMALSATAAFGETKIGERKDRQQQRIAQGVQSGSLTAGETARLENRESAINQEVRADRTANGGKLTPAERAQVNRQQNRASGAIFAKKHNGVHQQQ
jgi:hypothetical protein